jgi:hypothetical protein
MVNLSESFYIFLVTTTAGIFLAFIKLIYDSKCKKIKLCGLDIERDTEAEANIEHDRMEHGVNSNNNPINNDHRQSLDRPNA